MISLDVGLFLETEAEEAQVRQVLQGLSVLLGKTVSQEKRMLVVTDKED